MGMDGTLDSGVVGLPAKSEREDFGVSRWCGGVGPPVGGGRICSRLGGARMFICSRLGILLMSLGSRLGGGRMSICS